MRGSLAAAAVVCAMTMLPMGANAAEATASWNGAYAYAGGDAGRQAMLQAVDTAAAGVSFVIRPIARKRLRDTNQPYDTVSFRIQPGEIVCTRNGKSPIRSDEKGTPVQWTREDGKLYQVTQQFKDGAFTQLYKAEDGSRTNHFTLSADGAKLSLEVTVESPKLPKPLRYSLEFRRHAEPAAAAPGTGS